MAVTEPEAPLVGRLAESEQLSAAWRRARAGTPQVVLVTGEAGIGKSRLTEHFARTVANEGARVLTGGCVEVGGDGLPLAPIVTALRGLARELGPAALAAMLPGGDLGRLLPELGHGDAANGNGHGGQARLFQLLVALFERLAADQPLLLVVEDVHWSDQSTRDVLDVLARSLRDAPFLLLATYRTDDVPRGHPTRRFLAELERVRNVSRVDLRRFSRDETGELMNDLAGERPAESLVERVYGRSGGNAFFVEELMRNLEAHKEIRLGDSLRDLLVGRIDRLDSATQQAIRLVAVGGRWTSHRLIAAASESTSDELFAALRAATDSGVLVGEGDGYVFGHALLQEAVVDTLLPGERMRLHKAFAEAIERDPELVPDNGASDLAHHWWYAREPDRAFPALLAAADAARSMYAYAEQLAMLQRALEILPRVKDAGTTELELLDAGGEAARMAGHYVVALRFTDRAIGTARDAERDAERLARLYARRSRLLVTTMRDGAVAAAEEGARIAPRDTLAESQVLDALATAMVLHGRAAEALDHAERAVLVATEQGTEGETISPRITRALVQWHLRGYDAALAELDAVRVVAERLDDVGMATRLLLNQSHILRMIGRNEEAFRAAVDGLEFARKAGLSATLGGTLASNVAEAAVGLGDWDLAERTVNDALAIGPSGVHEAYVRMLGCMLAIMRGELEVARAHFEVIDRTVGDDYHVPQALLPKARIAVELALAEGRLDDARSAAATGIGAQLADQPAYAWALLCSAARAEALAYARDRSLREGAAPSLEASLREHAAELTTERPMWRAFSLQFAAELAARGGPPGAGWLDVVAAWEVAGEVYLAAAARVRATEYALASGDRVQAESLLGAAAEVGERLRARPLLAEIDLLARRGRLSVGDTPVDEPSELDRLGLTEREVEVLRRVAEGKSNREIAAELFISDKTASVHVSRILAKLAVTSRGEAAALAHRLRLFDVA